MDAVLAKADALFEKHRASEFALPGSVELAERSSAPYLFAPGLDDPSERLPLKSTSARISISGVIAQVEVAQVYQNRGDKPIEAVYVFPASTRAAVHGMRMSIGDRVITAKIEKRGQAREQYEAAKGEGKRAALLEQQRSNVFSMSVANVMPGDVIKTELVYSELVVPESGTYSLIYPTVVGPRNPLGAEPATHGWVANPHLTAGAKEPYRFELEVRLQSPIPLKAVSSPSHALKVTYPSAQAASIQLAEPGGGNRDFVLQYRLAGDQIQTGTLLYDDGGEKFFLTMVEPPQRVAPSEIVARELVFVLDASGSMNGFPLEKSKQLMAELLAKLKPSEYFNVVKFAGNAGVMSPQSLPATAANVQEALRSIDSLRGGGGTNLMDALRTSYGLPRPQGPAMSRSVVVLTDGYVAVEPQAFRFIRKRLGEANLFAFGIGTSVNRALVESMARAGMGSPFFALDEGNAAVAAQKLRQHVESPLLTNVQLSFRGLDVYDVIPQKLPDLLAERPLIAFGKYRGNAPGTIEVVGKRPTGAFKHSMALDPSAASADNRALRSLWARSWVEDLSDQHAALGGASNLGEAIEQLGLRYGMLTQLTSFVAVDSQVVNETGKAATVRQPLPMPQGVANAAVSGKHLLLASESSSILILEAIRFKPGSAKLGPESALILEQVVTLMRERPELRLGLYGHSEAKEGSSAVRVRLSKQRAEAVASYLKSKGIDPKRLEVGGLGDQKPIATGDTTEARAKNRRVEFKILE
jgi:Ca-activated chloride channel family protein